MERIQDYEILEEITETKILRVCSALQEGTDENVIIKILKADYPSPSEMARFKQEYNHIIESDPDGIVRTSEILEFKGSFALVQEDFDGVIVKNLLGVNKRFDIKSFLRTAIRIADILGNLHKNDIIHRDIKPHNILLNPKTGTVKITDFGIGAELTHVNEELYSQYTIENILPYQSPEQTGRMNRAVDYRTDLYSLGIAFYEMLTGAPPFISNDPMTLIHSHIAIQPVPPHSHNAKVPHVISDIIMKLLSKNTEDRYQSAFGLMADLKEALRQFVNNNKIEYFDLATRDISSRFVLPEKLYGRDKEIEYLVSDFTRLCNLPEELVNKGGQRGVEVLFVSGRPGIGKSALINEIQKPIVEQRGYFISGKYEQFRKDMPYSALIQAFQGLIKQILSENAEKIAHWRENLLKALGPNGKVIADIIPEIELIIGEQPELAELGPEESRNRFNYVLENFTGVCSRKEHPIALFLDDLQWADLSSLHLIRNIVKSVDINYLYLIGSYRDDEVGEHHALADIMKEIEKAGIEIKRITLGPLSEGDVKGLIVDFLRCSEVKGASLAEVVRVKTGGNPFFVSQFLHTLYDEGLLQLDPDLGWKWDVQSIRDMQVTDNVVKLMARKISRLPEQTREVLKICACVGNRFNLETIALIRESAVEQVFADLSDALIEGLVTITVDTCMFLHHRIYEAAYSFVPDVEKAELHYRIGKSTLDRALSENTREKDLFNIVDQLNRGSGLIVDPAEREELARMNLDAGIKAKASSAFSPAILYLETGIGLLEEKCWEEQYDLSLRLYSEISEASYLNGNFDMMDELSGTALKHTKTVLDGMRIYLSRLDAWKSREEFQHATNSGLSILKLLGVRIPKKPTQFSVGIELSKLKIKLIGKTTDKLLNLPEATDPRFIAIIQVVVRLGHVAFYINPNMFALVILRSIRLSLKFGNTPDHAFGYAGLGIIYAAGLWDFDSALDYGKLGLKLMDKMDARKQESKTRFIYHGILEHWKVPIRETIAPLQNAYQIGQGVGDHDYAAFNLLMKDVHSLFTGKDMSELENDLAKHNQIIAGFNQKYILTINSLVWQAALNFLGQCDDPLELSGSAIDTTDSIPQWIEANHRAALCVFYFARACLRTVYGEYSLAIEDLDIFKKYKDSMQGVVIIQFGVLVDSICRLFLYPDVSFLKKIKYRFLVRINQVKMKRWAKSSPENCLHKYQLIEALRVWSLRKDIYAVEEGFLNVIGLCRRPDNIIEEAVSYEILGRLFLSRDNMEKAKKYIVAAYDCFSVWGVQGKLNQLKDLYPEFLSAPGQAAVPVAAAAAAGDTGSSHSMSLDISTVVKVSQAISGEIMLENLLTKMITMTMENAGADKCFLILEDRGKLLVEAEGESGTGRIYVLKSIPLDSHDGLSSYIVNFVSRTKETLILNDAVSSGDFTNDPYIIKNMPKSVLCSPVLSQGKLSGILYLENNLTTDAFTPERLELLKIISSQIAISIDNAKLYENLEDKVQERTEDLQKAMNDMELLNDRLSDTNKRLEEAQRIAQLDMNMAINVQASLYPKEPPQVAGWDLAFAFKPMSGVSGDLFDFYTSDDTLDGIGIFDVSGHGIASGLITMIARSVFLRNFVNGLNEPLNSVLENANRDLIDEIGNVDNYLTGIILRFKESRVDYVNGGHSDLLVKRAQTGKAERINNEGRDFKGYFLGFREMENNYEELNFDLNTGDTILLYTDCLDESKNHNGEEYGFQRVQASLEKAPDSTSQEILEFLLRDFYHFLQDIPVSDDLTVIIARKV